MFSAIALPLTEHSPEIREKSYIFWYLNDDDLSSNEHNNMQGRFCMTRGIKNANHIQLIAPDLVSRAGPVGITGLIAPNTLVKLHTVHEPYRVVKNRELAQLLERNKLPLPKATVSDPLFNGTLYFARITFNFPGGAFSMNNADIQVAVNYSNLAVLPIHRYAAQYGLNSIGISQNIIQYSVNLTGNRFRDSDLQGWVDDIIRTNNLQNNPCIVVLVDVRGPLNSDGDPNAGVGGYHFITRNNHPYCFCNVFGQNLTIDDRGNVYAQILSHEIAEMVVDPLANIRNPEVCDACAGNCGNLWNDFFDNNNQFINGAQNVPPPFAYRFFINSIIKLGFYDPNTECSIPGSNGHDVCVYSPPMLLNWSFAGNTAGFGHGINDGRPFWIGNFSRLDRAEVLFYYPGDDNWWLGSHDGSELRWSFAGNTAGFGHGINDGRPFWIGDFNGNGRSDVLFYYPGDDNWWLGSHDGSQLRWSLAGNTAGFGHGINDGRPFWIGNFSRFDRAEVLFYYPGDDNWWLGEWG
jgi:hypothetical protein